MKPSDARRPDAPITKRPAHIKNKRSHDTAFVRGFLADTVTAAILGAALAWFTLEWADHSYRLAERAAQCFAWEVADGR